MKYTDKQIDRFKEMYQNGILEQLDGSVHVEIIDNIIEIDEATILAGCSISIDELIEIADTRCELGDLAKSATVTYDRRYPKPIEKPKLKNHRLELITLLDLRMWATKKDIINELNELL